MSEDKFTYFQLRISSFLNIAVHIDFVIESLVMFDNETFKRGILIAIQNVKQILHCRIFLNFID